MEQSNSHKLRLSLASAIRHHIQEAGMTGKQAASYSGVAGSRISAIMLGKVGGISCDALVDILGTLGYRLDSVIGATDGHEFTLTLDEGLGLPKDIEPPISCEGGEDSCGPVVSFDSEGIPLCETCVDALIADSEADPDADRVSADE